MHQLIVSTPVADLIRTMHPHLKQKVRAALDILLADQQAGKPLRDELAGLWSYRIGTFRIIYRIGEDLEIVAIGPRRVIYEETLRLVKRPPRS
ncbi:hypothetical protein AUK40_02485 [Candidatus Wirthbacteria bacterium CG2_30_54_11]|uniref:Cytotoxin n=1 Tax=Candidatus Wirthbacteria bacterium CG2_30_54_11 TaxID=1817892 RepID=A0A1J5IZS9_9BACT|nr:MAG: hypothetical protein AUK40_02485 [Candidatus Wirthbacteria bacterium CG2_30_54_11]